MPGTNLLMPAKIKVGLSGVITNSKPFGGTKLKLVGLSWNKPHIYVNAL
jgi:hypothetical protein